VCVEEIEEDRLGRRERARLGGLRRAGDQHTPDQEPPHHAGPVYAKRTHPFIMNEQI
jgi:hypothetical protein